MYHCHSCHTKLNSGDQARVIEVERIKIKGSECISWTEEILVCLECS